MAGDFTDLSIATGFDRGTVESALVAFAQAGRTMFDLSRGVWRLRELSREPLDLGALRWSNEREQGAAQLAMGGGIQLAATAAPEGRVRIEGRVERSVRGWCWMQTGG